MLQDLFKVEAKLQAKQLKEKEEAERQLRIVAKLKEKVKNVPPIKFQGHNDQQTVDFWSDCYLIQVDGQVSRDPTRLTRVTKGWVERLKTIGPSGGGPVTRIFHRSGSCLFQKGKEFFWITELTCFIAELFPLGDKACEQLQWQSAR